MNVINLENIEDKFYKIIKSKEFIDLQDQYNKASHVFFFGHGGNLGVSDHAAIDASRLTDKNVVAPGSGILATSIIGDTNFNDWLMTWLKMRTRGLDVSKCLVLGMSCSAIGESSDSIKTALKWSSSMGIPSFMFTATEKEGMDEKITQIIQGTLHYHTSEILSLMLTYQLIHGAGFSCPTINKSIKKKSSEDDINFYDQDVPPGMENEKNQISIDFDGVIHSFDLGWHDGTCYGKPIPGSLEAIKQISKNYDVIIHTAKIKNDRPHVNGKTGRQLVEEWLEKYGFTEYIKELTSEKPRAKYYIDDKAIKFVNWEETLKEIMG